jgi:site-specific DNA-methyltransferase (adenine-specific)
MEYMATIPDKHFDLAIVDPPYGIGETAKRSIGRVTKKKDLKWVNRKAPDYKGSDNWDDNSPDDSYFLELKRVSKNQIIWGSNHFASKFDSSSSGWVVWYKKRVGEVNDFSDAELAYTSYKKGVRLFHRPWIGFGAVNVGEVRIHPTQKPVKLYEWLLANYAKEGDKIFDTHLGSGSSAIAAHYGGFEFVGCELDTDYYKAACERFNEATKQQAFDL